MQLAPLCALLLTHSFGLQASADSVPKEKVSARRFVQAFYDWYTPKTLNDHDGPASDLALKLKSSAFSPSLLLALREDSAAQAKSKDEIVGLDFDPFLASQDPDPRYLVGKTERKGGSYYVSVHSFRFGKRSAKPDVIAKLEKYHGAWRFTNFIYPDGGNLVGTLLMLKQERLLPPSVY